MIIAGILSEFPEELSSNIGRNSIIDERLVVTNNTIYDTLMTIYKDHKSNILKEYNEIKQNLKDDETQPEVLTEEINFRSLVEPVIIKILERRLEEITRANKELCKYPSKTSNALTYQKKITENSSKHAFISVELKNAPQYNNPKVLNNIITKIALLINQLDRNKEKELINSKSSTSTSNDTEMNTIQKNINENECNLISKEIQSVTQIAYRYKINSYKYLKYKTKYLELI